MYLKIYYYNNNKMVGYVCPRCAYSTNKKCDIIKHINRVKLCKLVDANVKPKEYRDLITRSNYAELDAIRELAILKKENAELKNQLKTTGSMINSHNTTTNTNTTTNITNNTNSHNTVNINIHAYNDHDVEHLGDIDFKASLNRMIMCVPELVKRSHLNKDHPEYHNMYITNLRNNRIMAYDGEQWNVYNKNRLLDELIQNKELSIEEWLGIIKEKDPEAYEKYSKKYQNYEKLRDQEGVKEQIIEELEFQLFNYKYLGQENNKEK